MTQQTLQEYADSVLQTKCATLPQRKSSRVVGAKLPLTLVAELKSLAKARGATLSDLIREGAERVLVAAANDRKAPQKKERPSRQTVSVAHYANGEVEG